MVTVFFVAILLLNTNIFAAQAEFEHSYFFSKGKSTYSSHFPGISIWTLLIDEKVKFIYQAEEGRVVVKASLLQSTDCDQGSNIVCFDGTVIDVTNSVVGAIKVGDTFKITIDLDEKTETVSFLSGFLENVDVKIGLQKSRTNLSTTQNQDILDAAVDTYIYGYPLVIMGVTEKVMTNVPNATIDAAPINQFMHKTEFPNPEFKDVVRPNADTLYSPAWLDLSKEPIILHVPDTGGRYYLMPMLDAWTNVFVSPGKRTTGTNASDFIIEGPSWNGKVPAGVTEIKSPTNIVWILGRTQTNGVKDYDAVHAIQKQYTLTPLSSFDQSYQPPQNVPVDPTVDMTTPPVTQVNSMNAATFFNTMSTMMKDNPAAVADADMLQELAKIGITPGEPFDTSKLDTATVSILDQAVKAGLQKIVDHGQSMGTIENGWRMNLNIGSYGTHYLDRASVAFFGLGANLPQDAIYPATSVDRQGNPLTGANKYVIHFPSDQTPPVGAFWSITMYEGKGFFVKNPIDRYAIGDRDTLVYNEDGSIDIYIQHDSPQGHESNWLPSPQGNFDILMRMYWPQESIINGTWNPPSVEQVQ